MKILNTAVLGLGRVAWQCHIPKIQRHKGFRLAAVVDPLADRRAEAVAEHGCEAYPDFESLLRARRDLDLVVIASPTPFHLTQTLTAFENGLDVFCDKPMAMDLAETDRMIQAMRARGRKLMIFQPHRAQPQTEALRNILARDLIGPVYMIKRAWSAYTRRNDWQAFRKNGGGMLNNYGAHNFDLLLHLSRSRASHVACHLRTVASLGDAEDVVKAVIETENGVILDIDINMAAAWPIQSWFVAGKHGTIILDEDIKAWKVRYFKPSRLKPLAVQKGLAAVGRQYGSGEEIPWQEEVVPAADFEPADYYEHCYNYFALDRPPFVPIEESREVMRVLALCRANAAGEEPPAP